MLGILSQHSPEGHKIYLNTPLNKTQEVENILGIDGGFVVEILETSNRVTSADNQFYASFPILIFEKKYTLIISGNIGLIQESGIGGRKHPFSESQYGIYTPGKLTRGDLLGKNMNYSLLDPDTDKIIPTNEEFWKQLRNRIAASHPLSLIPQN